MLVKGPGLVACTCGRSQVTLCRGAAGYVTRQDAQKGAKCAMCCGRVSSTHIATTSPPTVAGACIQCCYWAPPEVARNKPRGVARARTLEQEFTTLLCRVVPGMFAWVAAKVTGPCPGPCPLRNGARWAPISGYHQRAGEVYSKDVSLLAQRLEPELGRFCLSVGEGLEVPATRGFCKPSGVLKL